MVESQIGDLLPENWTIYNASFIINLHNEVTCPPKVVPIVMLQNWYNLVIRRHEDETKEVHYREDNS